MAINKVITSHAGTRGAMRNCIEYVLKETKTKDGLCAVTGPFEYDEINWDTVNKSFNDEKRRWNKMGGRDYLHSIISFSPDEEITHEQALQFGIEIAENESFYKNFQTLVAVHQDRNHVHVHLVSNTVSFIDGHKEHHTKKDLLKLMENTNKKCEQEGFKVCHAGCSFDGTKLEEGEITTFKTNQYQLLKNNDKQSHLAQCGMAIIDSLERSIDKDEFLLNMKNAGWNVKWQENRQHLTFVSDEGIKVRDTRLEKTFHIIASKEKLLNEFERKNEYREGLKRFNKQIESNVEGTGIDEESVNVNSGIRAKIKRRR